MNWKLKARIVENFGSQRNFAKVAGIPEPYVSDYLRGNKPWPESHQRTAIKLLGRDAGNLMKGGN
jgi:hypothetical protein